jgi:VIT1/CCC1 family predicted Fe2+/Mn2+ transporter
MQTILLSIIAGLVTISMINMRYVKFEHESYIKRILTVVYWGVITGMLILGVSYLLHLIIPVLN